MYDILIKNAQLRHKAGLWNIAIEKGLIQKITKTPIRAKARKTIDAGGNLVTEPFVNTHLHLCKVYTLEMMDSQALSAYHGADMGSAMTAIELAARVKENYHEKWILPNVRKALHLAALNGNLHIRAFADVDSKAKLIGLKALLKARDEFKGVVEVQVVAFPQDGVVREPGTLDLMREAMDLGADVVGGIPWIEFTERDEQTHVDEMMNLAIAYDADISMLTTEYCMKVLCLARLLVPKADIRCAAGREVYFKGEEKKLLSVVDSIFASGYLTEGGQGIEDTLKTITDAGFTYEIESA